MDSSLTLSDYVVRYIDNCVEVVTNRAGMETVNLIGISTGSPLSAMYTGLFPEKVSRLGLQGSPLDFHVDEGMFDFRELGIESKRLVENEDNVPAPLVDLGFVFRKPVEIPVATPSTCWTRQMTSRPSNGRHGSDGGHSTAPTSEPRSIVS